MPPLLSLALHAAEAASQEIMRVYHAPDFQVSFKSDHSPVTVADKKSHEVIEGILRSTQIPILSEEGKDIPYTVRKTWPRCWLIDPLDGTKEFIHRNGEFTVNIALIENQKPVLGVVAIPVTGEMYYASQQEGAYHRHRDFEVPLPKRTPADLSQKNLRLVVSRSHRNAETENFMQTLDSPQCIAAGSSLKFMRIAAGAADMYPRFAPTMEWDTAAPHAILMEVGLGIYQQGTHRQLEYNKPNLLNPHFICY